MFENEILEANIIENRMFFKKRRNDWNISKSISKT